MGKAKLPPNSKSPDGRCTIKRPFSFYTEQRPDRVKQKRDGEKRESPKLKKAKSPLPSMQKESTLSQKLNKIKLFDVDVRIAKDTVVRIEMSDHDDPWTMSQQFQNQYNLTNGATAALYNMLKDNYDLERGKIAEKILYQSRKHSVVGEEE